MGVSAEKRGFSVWSERTFPLKATSIDQTTYYLITTLKESDYKIHSQFFITYVTSLEVHEHTEAHGENPAYSETF